MRYNVRSFLRQLFTSIISILDRRVIMQESGRCIVLKFRPLGLAVSTEHEQENTGTTEDQRVGRD